MSLHFICFYFKFFQEKESGSIATSTLSDNKIRRRGQVINLMPMNNIKIKIWLVSVREGASLPWAWPWWLLPTPRTCPWGRRCRCRALSCSSRWGPPCRPRHPPPTPRDTRASPRPAYQTHTDGVIKHKQLRYILSFTWRTGQKMG